MKLALRLAAKGAGWVSPNPMVGAVVVKDGRVMGQGYHRRLGAPHAEVEALRRAGAAAKGADLYVTLEPCTMCAGAMVHARIEHLVFAAREPRAGVICSQCSLLDSPWFNHQVRWEGGILAEESSNRLQAFFQERRS